MANLPFLKLKLCTITPNMYIAIACDKTLNINTIAGCMGLSLRIGTSSYEGGMITMKLTFSMYVLKGVARYEAR